jgi:hypothetical protein
LTSGPFPFDSGNKGVYVSRPKFLLPIEKEEESKKVSEGFTFFPFLPLLLFFYRWQSFGIDDF